MRSGILFLVLGIAALMGGDAVAVADERSRKTEQFLAEQFPELPPKKQAVWLRGELADDIENILGRPSSRLRVHYWSQGARSAWVLEEIGKELPITAGFVVNNGVLQSAQVLVYRESRGGEIQYTHFLDQFTGLRRKQHRLSDDIDNISGATLSVRSMKKMAAMALRLSEAVQENVH